MQTYKIQSVLFVNIANIVFIRLFTLSYACTYIYRTIHMYICHSVSSQLKLVNSKEIYLHMNKMDKLKIYLQMLQTKPGCIL